MPTRPSIMGTINNYQHEVIIQWVVVATRVRCGFRHHSHMNCFPFWVTVVIAQQKQTQMEPHGMGQHGLC